MSSKAAEGADRRRRAQGERAEALQAHLRTIDPQLAAWGDEFVFGEVWARPGLEQDERMLVAIVALAAGSHWPLLRNYLHGAVQSGVPTRKVHEALVQLVVYCGFPVAVQALSEWKDVLESSRRRGVEFDSP
jgi:4-carboxymuconolactone decarboxylase